MVTNESFKQVVTHLTHMLNHETREPTFRKRSFIRALNRVRLGVLQMGSVDTPVKSRAGKSITHTKNLWRVCAGMLAGLALQSWRD